MKKRTPYTSGARMYDVVSGEPVYRPGRVAGISMLGLELGDVVLDLGCGTGLNFELLRAAVGPYGQVIGLDRSQEMLSVAQRRIDNNGWNNVSLVQADATAFTLDDLPAERIDAVLATYSLSVVDDPAAAWERARAVIRKTERVCGTVRPGGKAAVVDMQRPSGAARVFTPIVEAVCKFGHADLDARPWTMLLRDGRDLRFQSLRGGHIQVVAGVLG
ncbi:methyltransferase domain-containing protein [Microbacterium sp. NPDC076768]|uniref:class I SAM-dependent methyltransferase n=1 Tax=Microbacterium sp. NPDC076768 TaxID=3154858 RepID=UPI00341DDF38